MKDDIKFTIKKDPASYAYRIEIDINLDALELDAKGRDVGYVFIEKMGKDFKEIILELEKMYIESKYKGRYTYAKLPDILKGREIDERPKKQNQALPEGTQKMGS